MTWSPNTNSHRLLLEVHTVLSDYSYDITPKQLFYRLVSRGVIENTSGAYRKLQTLLLNGRKHGYLQPDLFIERLTEFPSHEFIGPAQYLEQAASMYRVNRMALQDDYVEVWVETEALARFMESFLGEYDIPVFYSSGYSGYGFTYNAHLRLGEALRSGKLPRVLYFSDFSASSFDIYEATIKELSELMSVTTQELKSVMFRVGVSPEHIVLFGLPSRKSKKSVSEAFSKEFEDFFKLTGFSENSSVELESLEPEELQILTLNTVFSILRQSRYAEALELETTNIEKMQYVKDSIFKPEA